MGKRNHATIFSFLVFFLIGLALVSFLNGKPVPSKPMVTQEKSTAGGAISKVAAQVSPSVVGITNLSREGDLFSQRSVEKSGSGVIVDASGYIVTNNHVVRDAQRLIVTLADGVEKEAQVVGTDSRTDLALVRIRPDKPLIPLEYGNSDELVVGEEVVAIGNPLGLRFARSVTAGVVSGLNRLLTSEEGFTFRLIQTDAAINPGNSGGALVNLEGKLVGINTVKIAAEGFEGMGFSIPSNQVQMVVKDLRQYGRVLRPVLGIKIVGEVSKDQAKYMRLPVSYGVVVEPRSGGPAIKAGMRAYDIITAIDGEKVQTGQELQEKIFVRKIGQEVKVQFLRLPQSGAGKPEARSVKIKLAS